MEQNDIYSDKTFFVLDHNDDATLGFKYYLSQNGTRDMIAYDNCCKNNYPIQPHCGNIYQENNNRDKVPIMNYIVNTL